MTDTYRGCVVVRNTTNVRSLLVVVLHYLHIYLLQERLEIHSASVLSSGESRSSRPQLKWLSKRRSVSVPEKSTLIASRCRAVFECVRVINDPTKRFPWQPSYPQSQGTLDSGTLSTRRHPGRLGAQSTVTSVHSSESCTRRASFESRVCELATAHSTACASARTFSCTLSNSAHFPAASSASMDVVGRCIAESWLARRRMDALSRSRSARLASSRRTVEPKNSSKRTTELTSRLREDGFLFLPGTLC